VTQSAITVEHLSKRFLIGAAEERATTFYDAISSTMMAPLKRFRRLSQKAPTSEEFWALKDINFEVPEGEVVGIIGHNGAGKSTLLKILSRITEPTEGQIKIRGRVASLLEVGTGFHPELTGRENIYLNGSILGMSRTEIDANFDAIVDFSGIEQFLDTPFKRYSSGMGVRLAFAVAAHLDPEILIIDEVLAVGDAHFQRKCLGKMSEVAGSGRTVLFVSHNMAAVENLCNRAILLQHGQLTKEGPTTETIQAYMSCIDSDWDQADAELPKQGGVKASVKITNEEGGAIIAAGRPTKWIINLEVDLPLADAEVGFRVMDHNGNSITTIYTMYQSTEHWRIENKATIQVDWPDFNLSAGRYYVTFTVVDGQEVISSWEKSVVLDVSESDYFGTGRTMPAAFGATLSKVNWKLVSQE